MAKAETTYAEEEELRKMTEVDIDAEAEQEENNKALAVRGGMMKVGGQWSTAMSAVEPRNPMERCKQLVQEARAAGESFFYGWGAGKNRIEGPSVGLAMAAARIWGNCAVDFKEMQETDESWVFTSYFIDLQTGFTLGRQFRQSKNSVVHGKHDAERKDDMRFQIGQSKAARNVVCNALPKWMISQALKAAKEGVRARITKYIEEKGIMAAVDICLKGLKKHGVTAEAVLDKFEKPTVEGLLLDDIVMMRGDLYALDENQDRAESLYPYLRTPESQQKKGVAASSVNDKLKGEAGPANGNGETVVETVDEKAKAESDARVAAAWEKLFAEAKTVDGVRKLYREFKALPAAAGFSDELRTKVENWALAADDRLTKESEKSEQSKAEKKTEPKQEQPKGKTPAEPADPLDEISSSGEPDDFKLGGDKPANGKKK